MNLNQIIKLLRCEVLSSQEIPEVEITKCLSSDMMSDVLAFAEPGAILITGLTNSQSVRTADIADATAIIYIRGKRPDEQTMELAEEMDIPIFATELGMFEACGILHEKGIEGIC
jgi:predicted transcriptional regulator